MQALDAHTQPLDGHPKALYGRTKPAYGDSALPLEDSYHGTGVNDEGWCDSCPVLLTASLYGSTVGSSRFVFLSSSRSDEVCCTFPSSSHGAPMRLVAGSAFLPLGMVNASLGGGGCKESVFRWSYNRPDGHIDIR